MIKRYTFEQLDGFAKGYSLSKQYANHPYETAFYRAISKALAEIHQLVTEGKDLQKMWNRETATNYHTWLSFDENTRELVYDTGSRDEEWSTNLIDLIFTQYDYESIKKFEELKKTQQFKDEYNVIREYYEKQGYFSRVFNGGIQEITSSDWQRVSTNKYAQKVFVAFRSEPLYKVGDIVSPRASREITTDKYGRMSKPLHHDTEKMLVLSNTEPIISARKGAKRYKVAPIGGKSSQPFWIEEAFLKNFRKKVNKRKKRNV